MIFFFTVFLLNFNSNLQNLARTEADAFSLMRFKSKQNWNVALWIRNRLE